MQIRIETDGTPENTRLINLRTGEEVKNLEVEEIKYRPWWANKDMSNVAEAEGVIVNILMTGVCPDSDNCGAPGKCHGMGDHFLERKRKDKPIRGLNNVVIVDDYSNVMHSVQSTYIPYGT